MRSDPDRVTGMSRVEGAGGAGGGTRTHDSRIMSPRPRLMASRPHHLRPDPYETVGSQARSCRRDAQVERDRHGNPGVAGMTLLAPPALGQRRGGPRPTSRQTRSCRRDAQVERDRHGYSSVADMRASTCHRAHHVPLRGRSPRPCPGRRRDALACTRERVNA